MDSSQGLWACICLFVVAAFTSEAGRAQTSDLSNGGDFQVEYAVWGNADRSYENVTNRVSQLLTSSINGFPVRTDVLHAATQFDESMSLIIFFNYNGNAHFYVASNNGRKISLGLLKEAARIDESRATPLNSPGSSNNDFPIIFAVYGGHEAFWNVTDAVKKLLRESPQGFIPRDNDMGGDPEWGTKKALIIISISNGQYHSFSTLIDGPKITKKMLLEAE